MKRNKRTAICFGIFLVLFLMTVGNVAAAQVEGKETQITTHTSSQLNPDIYGDKIVWQDGRNGGNEEYWNPTGNWDIYMYDVSTSTETQITTSESCQINPAIYGDKIVWQDDRDGKSDIYMYDLSAQQETQISTSGTAYYPAIYGDRIVWKDDRDGISDIYMYDLSTSQETRISTLGHAFSGASYSGPDIYNDKIVWQESYESDFSTHRLVMYDLSTQQETQIAEEYLTMPYSGFYDFAIQGDKIVYSYYPSDDSGFVDMYDLSTQQTTGGVVGSFIPASPAVYGDRIVWVETSYEGDYNGEHESYFNIYMHDLSTQQETQISTSGTAHYPAIYGNRTVWQDERNGNLDIYMFTLASDKVPELPVADFATNVSEGSAPLSVQFSDLSENAVSFNWDFGDGANSTEKNPVHTYSMAGIYTFNLTVTNENGTDSKLATINVSEKTVPDDNETDEGDGTGNETEGTETQITTNESEQFSPVIYEDRIVWTDWRNGDLYLNGDIYMYNISTSTETQITTNGSNQMWPTIYGDKIVWTDERNGNEDIYVYDLSTSTETQITTNESNQYGPAIYGDRIVWLDERNSGSVPDDGFGGFDVYMYNLSTKKETRITKSTISINPDMGFSVNIYDNKIVCYMGPYGISVYDLSTRQENVISDLQLYNLAFSGNRIAGTNDWEGREGVVYMYDLSTATKTKITADVSAYGGPDISGNRVVWPDLRIGDIPDSGFGLDLYMYDLSTSIESRITTSKSVAWSAPSIYGNRIVWQDERNGNSDIYMFTLASDEVPPLDDNDTDEGNETDDDTQVPDNDSDNGDDTETDNETEVPDNDSDNGAGNETDDGTQVPDNDSDTGTGNETDDGTQVPDNCSSELTPLDSTQALKEYVECTYKCHEKTKTGLTSLLDTSVCYYENGEDEKAVSMLKSFIHLAERMNECEQISAGEADYMVRGAKKIIDQIEAN